MNFPVIKEKVKFKLKPVTNKNSNFEYLLVIEIKLENVKQMGRISKVISPIQNQPDLNKNTRTLESLHAGIEKLHNPSSSKRMLIDINTYKSDLSTVVVLIDLD